MKSDELLMAELQSGNVNAFDLILHRYEKAIINYSYRITGNFHQAEELAQEAFFRVYRCALNFNTSQKFSTWLYKITSNLCIDELRKGKNKKNVELSSDLPAQENIEEEVEKKEIQEKIKKAVRSLSDEHRAVFIMKHYQGLSYKEIARILDCPPGTVKSRMHYAIMELKKALS